jgi:hypothetical protein
MFRSTPGQKERNAKYQREHYWRIKEMLKNLKERKRGKKR